MPNPKQVFVRLIFPHQGLIRSLCGVYFHQREDQEDAFQDVLLQLWKAYPTFRGESSLATWVYKVALNTLLNKVKRAHKIPVHADLEEFKQGCTEEGENESVALVQFALNQLSPADKALMVLYLEGYQYREIAAIRALTPTNVSTRLSRIKHQLKKILTRELSWK